MSASASLALVVVTLAACARGVSAQPACTFELLLPLGDDLPGMPLALPTDVISDAQYCAFQCVADALCRGYNYVAANSSCSALPQCPHASGCCWLKARADSATSAPPPAKCDAACSFIMRPANGSVPSTPPPAVQGRNVLYILVDDMRPDASPFGAPFMRTPALDRLARGGVQFNRTYCQIAVCSPSRNSFLTGRYPAHTGVWNFLNHFRQATCAEVLDVSFGDTAGANSTRVVTDGGAGQCCSFCVALPAVDCAAWTLSPNGDACTLFSRAHSGAPAPMRGAVSGLRGGTTTRDFVSLPQHLLNAGYLSLGTGKIYHTEEGGEGPAPWDGPGSGMPPLQDPLSWSTSNASMANVNALAPMRGCAGAACSVDGATLAGDVPSEIFRFEDKIIGDDALEKLKRAAANRANTGQPFLLAVGFRKPHLPFRHPAPYDDMYPALDEITLAAHKTLDPSIPPVAYHPTGTWGKPYEAMPDAQAQLLRRNYYACISWTDFQIGRLLDALDALGLANDTAVVFHADHGWSLGENSEWEKFTTYEAGTRVPLIVRAPWLGARADGQERVTTSAIAELVDIFPTLAELAGVPVPTSYGLDGVSLVPALRAAMSGAPAPLLGKDYALSVYPRCPAQLTNSSTFWEDNDCLYVERSAIPIMGLSLRVDAFRYTEWRWWDGAALQPNWTREPVGVELYPHAGDVGGSTSFDDFEFFNAAGDPQYATVQAQLAAQLHAVYTT